MQVTLTVFTSPQGASAPHEHRAWGTAARPRGLGEHRVSGRQRVGSGAWEAAVPQLGSLFHSWPHGSLLTAGPQPQLQGVWLRAAGRVSPSVEVGGVDGPFLWAKT